MSIPVDERWFEANAGRIDVEQLSREFEELKRQQSMRIQMDRFWCSLVYDRAYQGFTDGRDWVTIFSELLDPASGRLNENVIARIVATLCARFAKHRTMPKVLTTMGDWALQRRAEKYSRLFEGVASESRLFRRQRQSDMNAIICGTGGIGVSSAASGKLQTEWVPSWQLYVNAADARDGEPAELYRRQMIPRHRLIRMYPKKRNGIRLLKSEPSSEAFDVTGNAQSDLLEVVTAWHLPSDSGNDEADDGRVVVFAGDVKLVDELWDRPRFPIAFARYHLAPDGFFGCGVVQGLIGLQIELNRTLANRQTALEVGSGMFVAVERGSKILETALSDEIGRIVEYNGTPPQFVAPGVIHPEQFTHGDRVKSSMFQNSGVSELAASSMKPSGLDSGKAIRTYADMLDDAFHDALLRRDEQMLDCAEIMLDEIESICEERGEYRATYVGPFGVETIKYNDVKIDRDSMRMKVTSTSALATSFSGRIQDVIDLKSAGVPLTPQQTEQLIGVPDLLESEERRFSMENLLRHVVEETILGDGKWWQPEPRWDLDLCLTIVGEAILRAQIGNAPTNRLELLRKWEAEVMRMQQMAMGPDAGQSQVPVAPELPLGDGQTVPAPSPIAGGDMPAGPVMGQGTMQ